MRLSDENQCLVITKLLIEAGCSPCELDADDKPPIHAAVARGFVSVVEYLLSRDVPLPSRILFAALQIIVVKRVEMIRLLVSKGANVHLFNPDGDALLHITMRSLDRSVCLEIAEILIDVGCNPLARNSSGETPLHIAAKQGYHEIINYLILFSSSSDISSLLRDDPAVRALTIRSLIGNTDGLRMSPEQEARVMQVVRQFLDDEDKCLEWTKIFVSAAGGHFACSSGNAVLIAIAVRRAFGKVVEYLISKAVPLPSAILFTALRSQPSMIPFLVCGGADVHVREEDGGTLLHAAISKLEGAQCLPTTRILVEAGCDPFARNIANRQPIHIAISRGFESVVGYLLSYGFHAEAPLPPDLLFTALQCHGRKKLSTIQLLVDHGVDVSHLAPNEGHLLHTVLESIGVQEDEYLQITKLLCEAGCNFFAPDASGNKPLHIAISRGFKSVVEYLLSHGFNAEAPLPPDLLFAALRCREKHSMIQFLVYHGVDVSQLALNEGHLLHTVLKSIDVEDECLQTTKFLCEAGCNFFAPDASGNTLLHIAITRVFTSVVDYLLSRDVPLSSDVLFLALDSQPPKDPHNWISIISSLVRKGANIHARDRNRNTLLHRVLSMSSAHNWRHCLEVIKIFTDAGCNASIRNVAGKLPIQIAVTHVMPTIVEYLLSRNAAFPPDILLAVWEGQDATSSGVLKMVSSFVEHGADVCAMAANGDTVLHVALAWKWWRFGEPDRLLAIVDVLVRAGCNLRARDAMGRTPLEFAAVRGYHDVVGYLQRTSATLQ